MQEKPGVTRASCGCAMERQDSGEGGLWALVGVRLEEPSQEGAPAPAAMAYTGLLFGGELYRCPSCRKLELYDNE